MIACLARQVRWCIISQPLPHSASINRGSLHQNTDHVTHQKGSNIKHCTSQVFLKFQSHESSATSSSSSLLHIETWIFKSFQIFIISRFEAFFVFIKFFKSSISRFEEFNGRSKIKLQSLWISVRREESKESLYNFEKILKIILTSLLNLYFTFFVYFSCRFADLKFYRSYYICVCLCGQSICVTLVF